MNKIFIFMIFSFSLLFSTTLEEIKARNEIKIGVRNSMPPFSKFEDGEFSGFEVEFAKKLGNAILENKGTVTIVGVEAKDRIPKLQDDSIDLMVANFTVTKQRQEVVDFSVPYFADYMGILAKTGSNLKLFSNFAGKRLLVIPNTTSEEYVKNNPDKFNGITIVNCDGFNDCYYKLQNDEADGYFHTVFAIANIPIINSEFEITNKAIGSGDFLAVGIKKGNSELLQVVNNTIFQLSKEGFFKQAYDLTFNTHYKGTLEKKYFLLDDIYNFFVE